MNPTAAVGTDWTFAGRHVSGLVGQGLLFADQQASQQITDSLREAGYHVVVVDGSAFTDAASARQGLARALDLETTAANNADAFADSLSDLSAPGGRLALVWTHADTLADADLPAWTQLAYQLQQAADAAWDTGSTPLVLETIACLDGHGIALQTPQRDPSHQHQTAHPDGTPARRGAIR